MNKSQIPATDASIESDPSAELGLRSPVRDKEKLGDEQYNVTPPREAIHPPNAAQGGERCKACAAEVSPEQSLRSDADEYDYYFCNVDCRERWQRGGNDESQSRP